MLTAEAARGDERAFRQLFESLETEVFPFLLVRTGNRVDALELFQETMIDVWQALVRKTFVYQSDAAWYGFVYRIARKKLARYYDTKPNQVALDTLQEEVFATHMTLPESITLVPLIANLTESLRIVIELRYISGLSFRAIATRLDISTAAAKVRHHRALKQLAKQNHYA